MREYSLRREGILEVFPLEAPLLSVGETLETLLSTIWELTVERLPRILPNDNATLIYNIKEHFNIWNFNRRVT